MARQPWSQDKKNAVFGNIGKGVGIGTDIYSIINSIMGNVFQKRGMEQQGEQWEKEFGLKEEMFGLDEDRFRLTKMLGEQQLYSGAEKSAWKRNLRNALRRG